MPAAPWDSGKPGFSHRVSLTGWGRACTVHTGGTDTPAAPSEEGGPCANDVSLNATSVTRDVRSVTVGSGKQDFDYLYAEPRASPPELRPSVGPPCAGLRTGPRGVGGP